MKYENLTTSSLIDKCAGRDAMAWAEFVKRFSSFIEFSIKKTLKKCVYAGAGEDVKDILQNLLMSLWKNNKLTGIRQRDNINFWLAITARNAAINHLRAKKKEVLIKDESYFEKLPADKIDRVTTGEALEKKIKEIYKLLSPREKLIFKLYFYKEMKAKDAARMLGISVGNVTATVTRIRQKIRSKT